MTVINGVLACAENSKERTTFIEEHQLQDLCCVFYPLAKADRALAEQLHLFKIWTAPLSDSPQVIIIV
jgi:hypothetical protein